MVAVKGCRKMVSFCDTPWKIAKKDVIFCQFEFVGVHGYGRVQIGKKQVTARKFRCFPCGFIVIILFRQEQALALHLNIIIKSLAVERLFRRSDSNLWLLLFYYHIFNLLNSCYTGFPVYNLALLKN